MTAIGISICQRCNSRHIKVIYFERRRKRAQVISRQPQDRTVDARRYLGSYNTVTVDRYRYRIKNIRCRHRGGVYAIANNLTINDDTNTVANIHIRISKTNYKIRYLGLAGDKDNALAYRGGIPR